MGTLERIRQTSPYLLAAFAVIFIAFFVISDMDPNTTFRRGNVMSEEVLVINDEPILYKDVETKARAIEEQQREVARNNPNQEAPDGTQIRNNIVGTMIDITLLRQEADKAGCNVSKGEILDAMMENPPQQVKQMFSDSTGKFDKAMYQTYLTRPEIIYKDLPPQERNERLKLFRDYFIQIQEDLENNRLYQNINTLVTTSGSVVSPLYAQEMMKTDSSLATVDFISFDASSVKDEEVKVTDEDIKKYYDDHKNFYQQKQQRKIKYVTFPIVASKNDSDAADKKVKRVYESLAAAQSIGKLDSVFKERSKDYPSEIVDFTPVSQLNPRVASILNNLPEGQFAGPVPQPQGFTFYMVDEKRTNTNEEVKASHILIKFEANKPETKEAAKTKIDEVLAKAKSGSDFAELAKEFSQDGSAPQGGDLGFFKRGQMVKEFEDAAFGADLNKVVGPVETMFGYHLILVTDKKSENIDEMKYSEITIKPQISNQAKKVIKRNMYELVKMVNEEGIVFDSAAKKFDKKAIETQFFTRERNVPGFTSQYLVSAAFANKVGTTLDPWEDKSLGYVVAYIDAERKAGIATLDDKKDEIKTIVTKIKKLDLLKSKAEAAYNQVVSMGGNLRAIKAADSTMNIKTAEAIKNNGSMNVFGRDFVFTQNAYLLDINKLSNPIRGEKAYYIMQVVDRKDYPVADFKSIPADYIANLQKTAGQSTFNMWFAKIKEDANIEDNRTEIWGTNF